MNRDDELTSLLSLHSEKIGSRTLLKLKTIYGSYTAALRSGNQSLVNRAGLNKKQIESISERQKLLPRIEELVNQYEVKFILLGDSDYPTLLAEIPDPPAVLYVRGKLPSAPCVSIVGSRKFTDYGRRATHDIASSAGKLGLVVVSGLALGIDGIAHQTALTLKYQTIGVLPCGIEQVYPASHRSLAQNILTYGGALVSEFPLLTPPYRGNFPLRNRIIAGLSRATIVTEAAIHSGALLTAQLTIEYNRDLFAVPGDIYRPSSEGPNALLAMGSSIITTGKELADYYNIAEQQVTTNRIILTGNEQEIVNTIPMQGIHLDQVAEALQLDIAQLGSILVMLEMKGVIKHEGAGVYRKVI